MALYDATTLRITRFDEHVYQARSDGTKTRNFAYDSYFGLRVGGAGSAGTWLTDVPASNVEYLAGTNIVHVARSWSGLDVDEYWLSPIDLDEHALVGLLAVKRASGTATPVDAFALYNFHLGNGAPAPDASGETTSWNAARDAWMEWGPSGAALGYGGVAPSAHHAASPDNPFTALTAGNDLADSAGSAQDDAAAGLEWSLGSVATGQTAWAGGYVVLDSGGDVQPHIDAVRAWIAGRSPDKILADEQAAWSAWQKPEPDGLSALESALYRQSMSVLRMGQVSEAGKSDGQIVASLPPGQWNIAWVRDMAYATTALARSGHNAEAKRAIAFQLGADADKYESYVGHPYQISVVRYFGDGVEESDENADGPNVEFDGFGLFLSEVDAYRRASGDTASVQSWWPVLSTKIADVLVALQGADGLIAPDSSIWEVHWNGKQKRFAFTTIAAARGLCAAADLASAVGDNAKADAYRAAGIRAQNALTHALAAPDGTIAQSAEDLLAGKGFLDAAAIEAVASGLVDPAGKSAQATLASMRVGLVPATSHGFFRNDDGGWYDSQEWIFVDLRASTAMHFMNDAAAPPLLDWVTQQSADNFNLVSELYDASTADYAGSVPMVGFGAGAYALALLDRAEPTPPLPCGSYADEGAGGQGGAAGGAGSDAGTHGAAPAADSGCGCRAAGRTQTNSVALALALFGLVALRRRPAGFRA